MNEPAEFHHPDRPRRVPAPGRRSIVAVLAAMVLLLAGGCGDSDGDSAGDSGGSDTAETDGGSTDGGGGGDSDFCDEAQQLEDLTSADFDPTDLEQLQEQFQELSDTVSDAADVAPSEIQDDAEAVRDAFDDANQVVQSADSVDELEGNEAITALDTDSDVQEASNNLEEYVDENCDIETGGS